MGSAEGTKVVPKIAAKLGAENLAIIVSACEDEGQKSHQIWPTIVPECPPSPKHDVFSSARESYPKSSSSSSSSYSNRLPRVLEESESSSHGELYTSNTTSSNASFASSTQSFLHRWLSEGAYNGHGHGHGKRVKQKKAFKRISLISTLLWPLKKVRDGYMSCMMSMEGAGDLSGMAQGATFAASSKYFADEPLSKTDSRNYG